MSHAAFISFEINIETEKREIEDIKKNLISLANSVNSQLVCEEIDKIMSRVQDIEKRLEAIGKIKGEVADQDFVSEQDLIEKYNLQKSNLIKTVQNMTIDVSFDDIINERTRLINELIVQNGFLSKIVLEKMSELQLDFTPENFTKVLSQVKQENIDKQKHSSLKEELKKYVLEQNVDPKLKGSLLNEFMFIDNYQELADYAPYVKEILNQYHEAIHKNEIYKSIFKKYKYTHKNIEFIVQTDAENKTKPRYLFISKFKNSALKNNSFILNLNLDGTVSYDIGDYENHMCWSLAENVEQDLVKFGYVKSKKIITRGVSGARPLTREAKMKVNKTNA
ncbi:hypothetical protein NXS15_03610 [Mycoplasma sp. CSL7475-4]|uniref:hypothetical protein n=1 Tax=Mycoplasma sp. CSL7475-4 TaxID=2973942 RepID=UPI00216B3A8D|nr:hypothetical protein [Mycoplasma sp. CSL7475-4]MCS4537199.1 hypothetical protein [Mycoplasma sp. CSL7475-4]